MSIASVFRTVVLLASKLSAVMRELPPEGAAAEIE
jgi:hypothetical protein